MCKPDVCVDGGEEWGPSRLLVEVLEKLIRYGFDGCEHFVFNSNENRRVEVALSQITFPR